MSYDRTHGSKRAVHCQLLEKKRGVLSSTRGSSSARKASSIGQSIASASAPSSVALASIATTTMPIAGTTLRRWQLEKRLGHGLILSCFLSGYGLARFGIELVREPDAHIGLLATGVFSAGLTMGQLLCLPMITFGLLGFVWCSRQRLT